MVTKRQLLKMTTATLGAALVASAGRNYRRGGTKVATDGIAEASAQLSQIPLNGQTIPKYVDPVPVFGASEGTDPGQIYYPRVSGTSLSVTMSQVQQKILPASIYAPLVGHYSGGTYVFAYNVGGTAPLYPGVSIEARVGIPVAVSYVNSLPASPALEATITVDQSIDWANPLGAPPTDPSRMTPYQGPPPTVPHLHGAEASSSYDGHPEAWFTPNGLHGVSYATGSSTVPNGAIYQYPNQQEAAALWLHDQAHGEARANVYRGLAAFYLLRDGADTGHPDNPLGLPAGAYERELMVQDRQFDVNGQLYFPDGSRGGQGNPLDLNGTPPNPATHPFWIPEFFGDVIVVNGKSWPYLKVEPRRYRFRFLNAANARFFQLNLVDATAGTPGPTIWQIGTDGGLLDGPVRQLAIFLAPGERADVIVDFSGYAGQVLNLLNAAPTPYPSGTSPDPLTTGQVMQLQVTLPLNGTDTSYDPASGSPLRGGTSRMPAIVRLANPRLGQLATGVNPHLRRQITLVEVEGSGGPIEVLLNNTKWNGLREGSSEPVAGGLSDGHGIYATELALAGATEVWEIINLTEDAHPIHIHLVQFQLINRHVFDSAGYRTQYDFLFPGGDYSGQLADGSWGPVHYSPGVFIPGYGPPNTYDEFNADGAAGGNPAVTPFLIQNPTPPHPEEGGWKDTIKALPGQITRIAVRWAPQNIGIKGVTPGQNLFSFNPGLGPGYVWHDQILDGQDNGMLRPLKLTSKSG
jgi:spore coat protein A